MSDIPSSITKVQIEATRFRSAVSEFLLQQMGATINGLIDDVAALNAAVGPVLKTEIFTANGTFNVPATVNRVMVWGIGGGGGGSSGLGGGSGDGSNGANSTFGALATFRFGRGGIRSATIDNSVIFGGGGAADGQDSPFSPGGLAGAGATPANAGGGGAAGIGAVAATGGDGGGGVTDGEAGEANTGEGGGGGGGAGNPGGNGGGAAMFASRILTVTPSAAITITIGGGGNGAPSGVSAAGGNGGSGIIIVSYVAE